MRARFFALGATLTGLLLFLSCGGDEGPAAPSKPATPVSFDTFQAASVVIGQPNMSFGLPNGGGSVGGAVLMAPLGAPAQGSQLTPWLYVPDSSNNRVLGFNAIPASNGATGDFVLGQPNLTSNASGTSQTAMHGVSDCVTSSGKLIIADVVNNRVLIWNSLPRTTNVPADVVVGQPDFTTGSFGVSQTKMAQPTYVIVAGGKLLVADRGNNRVLIWNTIPTTNGAPADVVVGQAGFTTSIVSLSDSYFTPSGLWSNGKKLVVGDTAFGRVLIWNAIPTANLAPADVVVGAPDMTTVGSNTPSATSIGTPYGVTSDGTTLFVSDADFHRVLIYRPFPTANGVSASQVLGQSNFTLSAGNDPDQDGVSSAASAQTFSDGPYSPGGLRLIGRQLFVTDSFNNRVLIFNSK